MSATGHGIYRTECLDGELQTFRLTVGVWQELEERAGCGPEALLRRFTSGEWKTLDIPNTLFFGLVGAGMDAGKAQRLIKRWVYDHPMMDHKAIALKIVMASVLNVRGEDLDDKPGDKEREREEIDYSRFYRDGAAMGFSAEQVDGMTFSQFAHAVRGYNRANSTGEEITYPTDDQFEGFRDEVKARHEARAAANGN